MIKTTNKAKNSNINWIIVILLIGEIIGPDISLNSSDGILGVNTGSYTGTPLA